MRFAVKDTLTDEEIQSGLRALIKDGAASMAFSTLTGGPFLVAFALKLGASNLLIGLLAAIPPLAQLIQIPAIYLVQKIRNRKAISFSASGVNRLFWLSVAFIPFFFSGTAGLMFLVVAMIIYSVIAAVSNCSWNSWMRDLVPQDQLGSFFSKRMGVSTGLGIVLGLAGAFYIDSWKRAFPDLELHGFSILFAGGVLAGIIGVYYITTIPEPKMASVKGDQHFFQLVVRPFRDENFKELIMFLGSWNFAVNLAAPFFTVYMLQRLQLRMSFVIVLTVLSQITNVMFLRIWGKFSDRFSNKSVLGVSGPLFMACTLAFAFTTMPERYFLTVPLLVMIHIFMGISMAGVTLASGNIGLKMAPKGEATAYLAASNLVNSLAAGVAPILGGKFADFFAARQLSLMLKWTSPAKELTFQTLNFQHWDFFFLFAFLIGFYSIHRLTKVKEIGEVEEDIVIQELISQVKRNMRNLSSVGGLRQMVHFPISVVYSPLSIGKRSMRGSRKQSKSRDGI